MGTGGGGECPPHRHLTVTSPPYPMVVMWDGIFASQNAEVGDALAKEDGMKAFELMHRELDRVWQELWRVTAEGGFVCINIGDAVRTIGGHFSLYPNHGRILSHFLSLGFSALPLVLWRKQTNAPNKFMGSGMLPAGAYVTLEHEYILILRKGGKRAFGPADAQRRQQSAFFFPLLTRAIPRFLSCSLTGPLNVLRSVFSIQRIFTIIMNI